MRISLLTRVRTPKLYEGMLRSAAFNADGTFSTKADYDKEGLPLCSKSYNKLGKQSKADILCFVEDDVEFRSRGWDTKIKEIFKKYNPDIVGIAGTRKYDGGYIFESGYPYAAGQHITNNDSQEYVKVFSYYSEYEDVVAVDGMIMFVSRKFFKRNKFDPKLNQMFFYDIDLCLRARKVGVTCDILVKHSTKTKELYGVYPKEMKPIQYYWNYFHKKHGIKYEKRTDRNLACSYVSLERYLKSGQNVCFKSFVNKFIDGGFIIRPKE